MIASSGPGLQIGPIVTRLQTRFIHGATVAEVFDPMLGDLLEVTASEYGFVAELCTSSQNHPFLRILVLTDISWALPDQLPLRLQRGKVQIPFTTEPFNLYAMVSSHRLRALTHRRRCWPKRSSSSWN